MQLHWRFGLQHMHFREAQFSRTLSYCFQGRDDVGLSFGSGWEWAEWSGSVDMRSLGVCDRVHWWGWGRGRGWQKLKASPWMLSVFHSALWSISEVSCILMGRSLCHLPGALSEEVYREGRKPGKVGSWAKSWLSLIPQWSSGMWVILWVYPDLSQGSWGLCSHTSESLTTHVSLEEQKPPGHFSSAQAE